MIEGKIVPGQKVRHFRPRAVDLVAPPKQDLAEHRLRMGRPDGLVFPRRDGLPWRRTDVNNGAGASPNSRSSSATRRR